MVINGKYALNNYELHSDMLYCYPFSYFWNTNKIIALIMELFDQLTFIISFTTHKLISNNNNFLSHCGKQRLIS